MSSVAHRVSPVQTTAHEAFRSFLHRSVLSAGAITLWLLIASRAQGSGLCKSSTRRLATDLGYGERSVRVWLAELERLGLIASAGLSGYHRQWRPLRSPFQLETLVGPRAMGKRAAPPETPSPAARRRTLVERLVDDQGEAGLTENGPLGDHLDTDTAVQIAPESVPALLPTIPVLPPPPLPPQWSQTRMMSGRALAAQLPPAVSTPAPRSRHSDAKPRQSNAESSAPECRQEETTLEETKGRGKQRRQPPPHFGSISNRDQASPGQDQARELVLVIARHVASVVGGPVPIAAHCPPKELRLADRILGTDLTRDDRAGELAWITRCLAALPEGEWVRDRICDATTLERWLSEVKLKGGRSIRERELESQRKQREMTERKIAIETAASRPPEKPLTDQERDRRRELRRIAALGGASTAAISARAELAALGA